ncbi:MAG TPA: hypothetical protein VFZ11_00670 [Gemmatimonadaceae bacterium]
MTIALALHERWFLEDDRFPVDVGALATARFLVPLGIALAITAAALLLWRWRGEREVVPGPLRLGMRWEDYERLLAWMPLVIGLHAAVPLIVAGAERWLFVPSMPLPWHFLGGVVALGEIVVALSFLYGALTRPAAVVLALVWLSGFLFFGPFEPLEMGHFLGIAVFLFATGRGPLAFDTLLHRLHRPIPRLLAPGLTTLRVATGLAIAVTAFSEKLGNVPMALAFLERHPLNFFPAIGLGAIDDATFVLLAGTVELTVGLLLASGAFVRLTILILWLPFNLTLPFLGWTELVGHLPLYGIMALLLVTGERAAEAAMASGMVAKEEDEERSRADAARRRAAGA